MFEVFDPNLKNIPPKGSPDQLRLNTFYHKFVIDYFEDYKLGHFILAAYAAVPALLTPDLLYKLWLNFPNYMWGGSTQVIHPVAPADVLLSSIFDERGLALYEMPSGIRLALLEWLEHQTTGENVLRLASPAKIANFVFHYVQQPNTGSQQWGEKYINLQEWTTLGFFQPQSAADKLFNLLQLSVDSSEKLLYIEAIQKFRQRFDIVSKNEGVNFEKLKRNIVQLQMVTQAIRELIYERPEVFIQKLKDNNLVQLLSLEELPNQNGLEVEVPKSVEQILMASKNLILEENIELQENEENPQLSPEEEEEPSDEKENAEYESGSKLFLFCIGGTGVRVLKALIFLFASGVRIKADKVVPIIIDPDRENGDLNRTLELLKRYQSIRKKLEFKHNGFYYTDIQTLESLKKITSIKISDSFRYEIDGTRHGKFGEFLGLNQLDDANKALVQTLFSEQNLGEDIAVGFKGNPHVGSVILNQFAQSDEFKFFASRLNERDRVFIVSSIFGGTGASGFPLLIKNIRNAPSDFPNRNRLRNVPLGAITVMPYFGVQPEAGVAVDKNTFISKTKAALAYYENHLSSKDSSALNALYYIADPVTGDVRPHLGGRNQQNNAHYIEMLSALSIIDFMDIPPGSRILENSIITGRGVRAESPVFKDYGLDISLNSTQKLNFLNLGSLTRKRIAKPLIQYSYAVNYWHRHLEEELIGSKQQAFVKTGRLSATFLHSEFFRELGRFNSDFIKWLNEMDQNERSFKPLNHNLQNGQLHLLVEGIQQSKRRTLFSSIEGWGYSEFNKALNFAAQLKVNKLEPEQSLMAIFYIATNEIFEERKIGIPLGL